MLTSSPAIGPGYISDQVFNLSLMQPYSLKDLYVPFNAFTPTFVLYLPRSSDLNQIAKYANKDQLLEVTHYCMHGASKVRSLLLSRYFLRWKSFRNDNVFPLADEYVQATGHLCLLRRVPVCLKQSCRQAPHRKRASEQANIMLFDRATDRSRHLEQQSPED